VKYKSDLSVQKDENLAIPRQDLGVLVLREKKRRKTKSLEEK
jgi:hypothetical protein